MVTEDAVHRTLSLVENAGSERKFSEFKCIISFYISLVHLINQCNLQTGTTSKWENICSANKKVTRKTACLELIFY